MPSFRHYCKQEKDDLLLIMIFYAFENGQLRIDVWDGGIPYAMATRKIHGDLKRGEIAVNNFDKWEGILDSMINANLISLPHRYVDEEGLHIPICHFLEEIPNMLDCPELKKSLPY